ncbi:hypothetical protein [Methyloceanibacter marginalis]|uniref:hypothetical protein n=1 Tax=Methyloceanibacter marginalis TaxID=1774971 RepID=UPI00114D2EF1|nr:hypothetical protein [Methyloceanibacter marginalis]
MVSTHPILVVEDEFLIALDIVAALENAGHAVIGPASTVGDALAAIEREPLRGALLDAHLGGESAGQIADLLARADSPSLLSAATARRACLPPIAPLRWSGNPLPTRTFSRRLPDFDTKALQQIHETGRLPRAWRGGRRSQAPRRIVDAKDEVS